MKDDEVVAHYARAVDGSPGVIGLGKLAGGVGGSAVMTTHPRNRSYRLYEDTELRNDFVFVEDLADVSTA
jgi:hypothetical protein